MIIEMIIRRLGGLLAFAVLGILLFGIWRGTRRKVGISSGFTASWLQSPLFYLITSVIFFGISFAGWIPLPYRVSSLTRSLMLAIGSLLYFPGILFLLWGRLELGKNYFVSTGFGAQLFADQELVKSGPYAVVRHPMYLGLMLAALGSLFIYWTWTTLFYACFGPTIILRGFREETALAQMFGKQWQEYCQRVPMWIPRLLKRR